MEDNDDVVQTLIFMDFEVAGKLLETEFGGDLQPRNMAGLNETVYLRRLLESDVDMSRVPRIAEMSFVFVPRSLFVEAAENMHFKLKRQEDGGEPGPICIELAANVFTSQLNPELSDEDWALYEQKRASIRLRRTELESKNTFAQEWPAVHHLLSVCPKPACLVAHNGLAFDFRILMHELDRCGLLRRHPIPEGVFFLDSYLTFVDIEREHHATIRKTLDTIDWNVIRAAQPTTAIPHATSNQPKESPPLLQIDEEAEKEQQKIREEKQRREEEEDEIECLGGDCPLFENTPPSPACSSVIATDEEETREDQQQQRSKCGDNGSPAAESTAQKSGVANGVAQMEAEEEITFIEEKKCDETEEEEISRRRKRRRLLSTATVIRRQRGPSAAGNGLLLVRKRPHFVSPLDSLEPSHPFRFLRRCEWCPAKRLRVPAHIFEKDADGQWCFSEASSALLTDGGGKFKLGNIFRKVIGTDFRAHRAQADSEALLQVALAYGDDFLAHLNTKRAPFPKTTAGILPPTVEC